MRQETGAAILFGLWGLYLEYEQRGVDRGVRIATLFAQIAQTHALPDRRGLSALKPSVQALANEGVSMRRIDLQGSDLSGLNLAGVDFEGANLKEVNFANTDLSTANLTSANLNRAILSGAVLIEANLNKAHLVGAYFQPVSDILEALRFEEVEEIRVYIGSKQTVMRTNLSRASLMGADLSYANMASVNLTEATLVGADFEGTGLNGANVSRAKFTDALRLTESQMQKSCAAQNAPPEGLSEVEGGAYPLIWNGGVCPLLETGSDKNENAVK